MSVIERAIQVKYRHRVFFTDGVFDPANALLGAVLADVVAARASRVLVTVDANLAAAQPDLVARIGAYFAPKPSLRLVCPPVTLVGGERAKRDADQVTRIHGLIARHGICRHSYVVAVGGGAHLDVVGFAAATAHRGVRHVRLPTTTLAQADAGVGVKNGINVLGRKNFVGTFAPPFAVINDFQFLATLSPRDQRAGFVEAVKVALIRAPEFFAEIEREADSLSAFAPEPMRRLIRCCAELHIDHIASSGDPFESGSARPLDFGHWAAHKLEQLSHYRLRHGEAVAIGIALDTVYSRRAGLLDASSAERVLALLERLGFALSAPELARREARKRLRVLAGLGEFREHLGGDLTVTLLAGIGRGVEVHAMDESKVIEAVNELADRHRTITR